MPFTVQHEVIGLDVPMHDVVCLRELESPSHVSHERQGTDREDAIRVVEQVLHAATREVLHRHVVRSFVFTHVKDLDNVWIVQLPGSTRFLHETRDKNRIIGEAVGENLQRYRAGERLLSRAIDRAGSPSADPLLDLEPRHALADQATTLLCLVVCEEREDGVSGNDVVAEVEA